MQFDSKYSTNLLDNELKLPPHKFHFQPINYTIKTPRFLLLLKKNILTTNCSPNIAKHKFSHALPAWPFLNLMTYTWKCFFNTRLEDLTKNISYPFSPFNISWIFPHGLYTFFKKMQIYMWWQITQSHYVSVKSPPLFDCPHLPH